MLPAVAPNTRLRATSCPPARLPYGSGMMLFGSKAITFGAAAVTLVTLVIRNDGVVPATVEPTVAGESSPALTLQPGEQAAVARDAGWSAPLLRAVATSGEGGKEFSRYARD